MVTDLVNWWELDTPDATLVASEHPQQGQVAGAPQLQNIHIQLDGPTDKWAQSHF